VGVVTEGRQNALHGGGLGCLSSLLLQERGAGKPSLTELDRRFPEEPWVGLPAGRERCSLDLRNPSGEDGDSAPASDLVKYG